MIEWLNANQGATFALLTAVYVVATIYLAWTARRSNRLHAKNIDTLVELEKQRSRPVVILKFEHLHRHLISVVLANIGESTAVDIDVDIDPLPKHQDSDDPAVSFLHERTASLPPKAELKALVGELAHVEEQNPDLRYRGTVTYRTKDGAEYSEPFRIDLNDQLAGTQIIKRTVHDVAGHLKKIEKHLR